MKNLKYFLVIQFILVSCSSKKEVLLFQNINSIPVKVNYKAPMIQVNDILSIQVSALQPELAAPYNLISQSANGGAVQVESLKLQGYLVSSDGAINFPILGKLIVSGKSTQEIEEMLKSILEKGNHLLSPVVNVRLLNAKVTVLGEVARPGTFNFSEQNFSIIQALGMAGDLTIKSKRKEVLVIREENGTRKYATLDLTQSAIFESEYYYVHTNDVIVVNPNGARIKNAGYIGDPGTLLGVASVILSMIILLTR
jgi:polysaccharide export outer membrane protein